MVSGLLGRDGVVDLGDADLCAPEPRRTMRQRVALAAACLGACTVMWSRVMIACAVSDPPLAAALVPYVALAFVVGVVVTLLAWRSDAPSDGAEWLESPLGIRSALQTACLFQFVLFLIPIVQSRWGSSAIVATSAFVGLTDRCADALARPARRCRRPAADDDRARRRHSVEYAAQADGGRHRRARPVSCRGRRLARRHRAGDWCDAAAAPLATEDTVA